MIFWRTSSLFRQTLAGFLSTNLTLSLSLSKHTIGIHHLTNFHLLDYQEGVHFAQAYFQISLFNQNMSSGATNTAGMVEMAKAA